MLCLSLYYVVLYGCDIQHLTGVATGRSALIFAQVHSFIHSFIGFSKANNCFTLRKCLKINQTRSTGPDRACYSSPLSFVLVDPTAPYYPFIVAAAGRVGGTDARGSIIVALSRSAATQFPVTDFQ